MDLSSFNQRKDNKDAAAIFASKRLLSMRLEQIEKEASKLENQSKALRQELKAIQEPILADYQKAIKAMTSTKLSESIDTLRVTQKLEKHLTTILDLEVCQIKNITQSPHISLLNDCNGLDETAIKMQKVMRIMLELSNQERLIFALQTESQRIKTRIKNLST